MHFIAKPQLPMTKTWKTFKAGTNAWYRDWSSVLDRSILWYFHWLLWQQKKKQLISDLSKAKSLCLLCDDSTYSSVKENEAIYIIYFNLTLEGSDSLKVCSQFLKMNYLKDQTASGSTTAFELIELAIKKN